MAPMYVQSLAVAAMLSLIHVEAQATGKTVTDATCSEPKPKRGAAMLQGGANGTILKRPPAIEDVGDIPVAPLVVRLERVAARSAESGLANEEKTFYVGNITVGHPPQRLQVLFDTSSGNVVIPHRVCRSKACVEHRRYSSQQSLTSQDVDFNGSRVQKQHRLAIGRCWRDSVIQEWTAADLGTGKSKSVLVRDKVCVKDQSGRMKCAWPSVNVALSMDDVPFRAMPSDGIVGLGLQGLASCPSCGFFNTLVANSPGLLPQFAMSFGSSGGELHIGGWDSSALAAPLQWFPVHSPQDGYWQVPIQAVRVGNVTVDTCQRGCHAVLDTSAARLGVQEVNLPKLRAALTSGLALDGRCSGPELEFDLGGMSVKIGPEDYTGTNCAPELGALSLEEPEFVGVYTFGESVLRHYFVAFNWNEKKLGFAPSKEENAPSKEENHSVGGEVEQITV